MGQVADDMADGITCSLCGMYFQGEKEDELYEHGYPAVCWECWQDLSKSERKNHQRALAQTVG